MPLQKIQIQRKNEQTINTLNQIESLRNSHYWRILWSGVHMRRVISVVSVNDYGSILYKTTKLFAEFLPFLKSDHEVSYECSRTSTQRQCKLKGKSKKKRGTNRKGERAPRFKVHLWQKLEVGLSFLR
jgi:hypothetical protein